MSMVDELLDTLEAEDYQIPCQGAEHPIGFDGHVIEQPASVLMVCPSCGPRSALCAGRIAKLKGNRVACHGCGRDYLFKDWMKVPL